MNQNANIEPDLLESLRNSLAGIPDAQLGEISDGAGIKGQLRPDAVMEALVAGHELCFVVLARGDVFPRDARESVWQLKQCIQGLAHSNRRMVPMVLARALSEGARQFLRAEQVAYHDLSGSLFIGVDETFVLIDKPQLKPARRRAVSLFKGSRALVLHALFNQTGTWVSGAEIAAYAGVSAATVSESFQELERRDWLDVKGEGPRKRRRLTRPDALLDAWRDSILAAPVSQRSRYYVPRLKPEYLVQKIKGPAADVDLEFTGQFAAQSYAPYLSSISELTVRTFGPSARDRLVSLLGARAVTEGANLVVIAADAAPRRTGAPHISPTEEHLLATPLQVYLDLLEDHGRSKDMAEHLRAQKLVWS